MTDIEVTKTAILGRWKFLNTRNLALQDVRNWAFWAIGYAGWSMVSWQLLGASLGVLVVPVSFTAACLGLLAVDVRQWRRQHRSGS